MQNDMTQLELKEQRAEQYKLAEDHVQSARLMLKAALASLLVADAKEGQIQRTAYALETVAELGDYYL